MLSGDPADTAEHHERALRLAERAGDLVQAARIRTSRSGLLLDEGRYAEALAENAATPATRLRARIDSAAASAEDPFEFGLHTLLAGLESRLPPEDHHPHGHDKTP
ncbi:hypothetical protein C1I98_21085 [Spongiactinospora gelatinilytica]|uniref:Uncharacterized protein n=2 Tax=Spongiactinospora gelatinilytica TaxID=2666298 RepID=A0A2W2GG44_9ACTN|nr:hypothetical protein C1I98_21085 [Spongiactinospora gelatinilytica]